MGMNPLAAVSVARIIGRCCCGGQGILARGDDDIYLRQAGLGTAATWQSAAAVPAHYLVVTRREPGVEFSPNTRNFFLDLELIIPWALNEWKDNRRLVPSAA